MAELLPCPFCGGPVDLEQTIDGRKWWGVVCRNTRNLGGTCAIQQRASASEEAAVARWNMRAAPPPAGAQQAVADALRSFVDIKPLGYGAPGTRDIDMAQWNEAHRAAKVCLETLAAPAAAQGAVSAEDQWIEQTRHLNCPVCNGSGHVEDVLPQGDAAQRALLELLLLKDMKAKWEAEELSGFAYKSTDNHRLHNEQRANYLRRKPLAWEAARKAVAATPAPEAAPSAKKSAPDYSEQYAGMDGTPYPSLQTAVVQGAETPEPDDTPLETGEGDAR